MVGIALEYGADLQRPSPTPQVFAVLLDADGLPRAVIGDCGDDTGQVRFVANVTIPADRSLGEWTLPSPEMDATSLRCKAKRQPSSRMA